MKNQLLAAVLAVTYGATAHAQNAPFELQRLKAPLTFDGTPSEAAWQQTTPLPLTLYLPVFRGTPRHRSEIRVAYDDEHLYVAGSFYDTDPNGVRVNSLYRDRWNGDDALAIYIDAFNDNTNAKWLGITPAGMRFDQLVSDDGQTLNASWDGFWEAKSTITEEGWFTEVRIPFSTIGFQALGDSVIMGLTVTRLVARDNERVTFPAIEPRYAFRQPSVAQDVLLRGVRAAKPVYVTPYALTGVQQQPRVEATGASFVTDRDVLREVGFDIRYPISSELMLDVTANTDFAQVEADDEQINLDRISLFFPEKRRFFQERSELFDFAMGNGGRVFHSRQIGLAPNERVPVLGGARLVGRVGAWDVGALDMQTRQSEALPAENFGVFRVKRNVLNPYSTAGAIVTTRLSAGRYNAAYGVDGVVRVFGDDYLTARIAQTADDADTIDVSGFDRVQAHVNWRRRAISGLFYEANLTYSGSDYNPGLGFLPRRDFTAANIWSQYFFLTDKHPTLRRIWPGALAFSTFSNRDGGLESGQYALWLEWETKSGGTGFIEPKLYHEDVAAPFRIGNQVDIPAGQYRYADLQVALEMGAGARLRANVDARAGTYFDGTRAQIILSPTWNVSRHLELGGDYQHTRLRFDERNQAADIHVVRARVRTALNAHASGNVLAQYNSTTDRFGMNLRLRYNFAEGTDLWLVYDEILTTDRTNSPIAELLPLSASRTFVIKYSRTVAF